MKNKAKKFEIIILEKAVKLKAAKIMRKFSEKSFSELTNLVELDCPIYTSLIIPEQFYSGINDIVSIIEKLDALQIKYLLMIDDEESSNKDIYKFKNLVVSLADFR